MAHLAPVFWVKQEKTSSVPPSLEGPVTQGPWTKRYERREPWAALFTALWRKCPGHGSPGGRGGAHHLGWWGILSFSSFFTCFHSQSRALVPGFQKWGHLGRPVKEH